MGIFSRKKDEKNSRTSSLTESEIKQKLYGEFNVESSRTAGRRESTFLGKSSGMTAKSSAAQPAVDLFDRPVEQTDFPVTSREIKIPVSGDKQQPFVRPPEKNQTTGRLNGKSSYDQYREYIRRDSNPSFFSSMARFFTDMMGGTGNTNRFLTRQVVYWAAGVLVVFFLFWGVNALNVQREQAMNTKYSVPVEKIQKLPEPAPKVRVTGGVLTVPAADPIPEKNLTLSPAPVPLKPTNVEPAGSVSSVPVSSSRGFAVQVVTYPSEEYASKVVTSLREAGFKTFVRENVRPTGSVFYIVYIGSFPTAAVARQELARFRTHEISRPFSDAFVKTIEMKES